MFTAVTAASGGLLLYCIALLLFGRGTAKKDRVNSRLDALSRDVTLSYFAADDEMSKPFKERVLRPLMHRLGELISAVIPGRALNAPGAEKQKKMLQQAGWTMSAEEYTVLQLGLMICFGAAGLILAFMKKESVTSTLLYFMGGVFAAYAILRYVCSSAATRRKGAMEKQLPDMLDLLSVSVAAGLGFERAMLHIIDTMDGPLIDEFAVTYREMSMGRSRKDALTLLGERCGIEDLSTVTGALVQAGQLGIPMSNVLQTQSAALRRSRRAKVQEKAAKVSTKILLPMVGLIFPVLFIVLLGPSVITIVEQFK